MDLRMPLYNLPKFLKTMVKHRPSESYVPMSTSGAEQTLQQSAFIFDLVCR